MLNYSDHTLALFRLTKDYNDLNTLVDSLQDLMLTRLLTHQVQQQKIKVTSQVSELSDKAKKDLLNRLSNTKSLLESSLQELTSIINKVLIECGQDQHALTSSGLNYKS
jgi:hypothetical protein